VISRSMADAMVGGADGEPEACGELCDAGLDGGELLVACA
jgi:hypothetical protein